MSKDFREDYEQLLDKEMPDLWDRIEKNLPEKTSTLDIKRVRIQGKNKKKHRNSYKVIGGLAAACVVLFSAGIWFGTNNMKHGDTKMAAEESVELTAGAYDDTEEIEVSAANAMYEKKKTNETINNEAKYAMSAEKDEALERSVGSDRADSTVMSDGEKEEVSDASEIIDESEYPTIYDVMEKPESVDAKAAILIDATNGQILFEQNAENALPPASTTKMMTALLTIEAIERGELSMDQIVTVDNSARNITPVGGSILPLPIEDGEEVSIRDLLYAVLLKSDCVCCNILAQQVCGNVDDFVKRMNERAAELGCDNTVFLNTHGYKENGHVISAHDLARIAAESMTHPMFYEIVNSAEYTIPETNLHEARELRNTNWLLGTMWDRNVSQYNKNYAYPYAHGVKTGFTEPAGHCLVSYAQKDGHELVCVIMGAMIDTDQETGYLVQHMYEDSIKLYNWGFGAYERNEIQIDENASLIDTSEKQEEMTEEIIQPQSALEDVTESVSESESETEQIEKENGKVAKTVLISIVVVLVIMCLASLGLLIYRKFYYFD